MPSRKASKESLSESVIPGAWAFMLLFALVLAAGAIATVLEVRAAEDFMRDITLGRARMLATTIDAERLARLAGSAEDERSPDYDYIRAQLVRVKEADPRYRYIYLMGRNAAGIPFFFMGTAPKGAADYSPPGQEYPEDAPALARAFAERIEVVSPPVRDRWGVWRSSLVPILEPSTGELLAVYGMDIDASDWQGEVARRGLAPAAISLFAAFVILALYLFLQGRQKEKAAAGLRLRNEELEAKVAERTLLLESANAELRDSNGELARALEELKNAETQLVLNEKLAALGQLIAGIAHELNTPLGVTISALDSAGAKIDRLMERLPALLRGMEEERFRFFLGLVAGARHLEPAPEPAAQRSQLRRARAALTAEGFEDAASLAEDLVSLGREPSDQRLMAELRDRGPELLRAAAELADLRQAQLVGAQAAGRAAKVVLALRTFARQDPGGAIVKVDLAQELDTVLTLYQSRTKRGISVIRNYRPAPPVECRPDRLSQVWVNLVNNAVYAMADAGILEVAIRVDGPSVLVSVADDGPGLSPDARARAFTPFFTTKPAGEGSGLGLSLSKRIVEEHGGNISWESAPGRTVFTVRLPAGEAARSEGSERS